MIRLSFDRCAVAAALLFLSLMVLPVASAHAALCDSAGPQAGEIARLKRQIAANRSFEEKHDCAAGDGFACREIAGRIAAASVTLANLQGAAPMCAAKAVSVKKPAQRAARLAAPQPKLAARMETRCVRLSDGYYFPTPNSGFNTAGDVPALAAQCRFICDDPAMDVYRIGADRDADTMISLTTNAAYANLPHAGAYRTAAASKACDMARFYKAALAGKEDVSVKMGPRLKAEDTPDTVAMDAVDPEAGTELAFWNETPLRGTRSLSLDLPKKIRVVGAVYLPEE